MAAGCIGTQTPPVFKVRRQEPELIPPARTTPNEYKELSDIDDQEGLRFQIPLIFFYRNKEHLTDGSALKANNPVKVIKEALAKALVPYYPFAGRLREKAGRKLVVECNGQGILFIEADADVTLEEFGEALQPPFCLEELLFDVPGFGGVLHAPLLLIQVTRLRCGGFILAARLNHTMADAAGIFQFLNAVAEIARGAESLSVEPIWERHLLGARDPPRVTFVHHAYDEVPLPKGTAGCSLDDDMVHKSFFFGPTEMSTLHSLVLPCVEYSTTFEVLTACLWRCRTVAMQPDPEEVVRLICLVNTRAKFNPPIPKGYYGNGFALSTVLSKANELCNKPIGYAIGLVKKAKADVTEEYMRSTADLMVIKGRPLYTPVGIFIVSDNTKEDLASLDYGWGPAIYGGVAKSYDIISFYVRHTNNKGDKGILVPITLPARAMKRFIEELNGMLHHAPDHCPDLHSGPSNYSRL